MRKHILSALGLSLSLAMVMAVPAYAAGNTDANINADGTTVTAPGHGPYDKNTEGGQEQVAGESYGQATIDSADGQSFQTTNDDDALAGENDLNGADINVWAKVVDSGTKVYKVDIAWGTMKFEFNSGSGQWNTETHTYDGSTGVGAIWTASYIDGTNNKVTVTNHSNNAVDASFAYAMETATKFNDAPTGDDAVVGHFFKTNENALNGSKVVTGTYNAGAESGTVTNQLPGNKVSLPTADAYNSSLTPPTTTTDNHDAGPRSDDVFFAFSGTPDAGRGTVLDSFKKVGVITVTVVPNNELPLNQGKYVAP